MTQKTCIVSYTKHRETKKSVAVKDNFDWKITATALDVTDTEKKKITNRKKCKIIPNMWNRRSPLSRKSYKLNKKTELSKKLKAQRKTLTWSYMWVEYDVDYCSRTLYKPTLKILILPGDRWWKRSFGCTMANSICDSYYCHFYHDCCQYYFAYHSTHIRVRELKHSIQDKSNMRLLNLWCYSKVYNL